MKSFFNILQKCANSPVIIYPDDKIPYLFNTYNTLELLSKNIIDKNENIGGCHRINRHNNYLSEHNSRIYSYFSEHGPRIYSDNYHSFINLYYNKYFYFIK